MASSQSVIIRARQGLDVINQRIFPIARIPLVDKFIFQCLTASRLHKLFPSWVKTDYRVIMSLLIFSLVSMLLMKTGSFLVAINVVFVTFIGLYARFNWLMTRMELASQCSDVLMAVEIAADGLPVSNNKELAPFEIEQASSFARKLLADGTLKGIEFYSMYIGLNLGLMITDKEIKEKKRIFEEILSQRKSADKLPDAVVISSPEDDAPRESTRALTGLLNDADGESACYQEAQKNASAFEKILIDGEDDEVELFQKAKMNKAAERPGAAKKAQPEEEKVEKRDMSAIDVAAVASSVVLAKEVVNSEVEPPASKEDIVVDDDAEIRNDTTEDEFLFSDDDFEFPDDELEINFPDIPDAEDENPYNDEDMDAMMDLIKKGDEVLN